MNKQKVHIHLVFNPFSSWVIYMKNVNEKQRLNTLKLFKRIHIKLLYAFILNRSYSINVQSIAVTHKALSFSPNTVIPKCAVFAGTVIWLGILVKDKILYFYFNLQTVLTEKKKKKALKCKQAAEAIYKNRAMNTLRLLLKHSNNNS